ncbi:MAG: T9SS type A sorting domain-containing protein [Paludibacteraceae bacterium]|nr:T9SS type A sorting domain-containing protein [Paludibacteraceae bacterium]
MKSLHLTLSSKTHKWLLLPFIFLTLATGNAWGATAFTETFAGCTGTMGWSGSAANGTFTADNTGWTVSNAYGAGGSAKFGTSSKLGTAQTPAISCGTATTATLTFNAGAWDSDTENTTLNLSFSNCSGDKTSVTLARGSWTTYTVALSNITSSITITFTGGAANKGRFFLDDVVVTYTASCTSPLTALSITNANTVAMGNTLSLTTTGGNGGTVTWSVANGTGSATVSGSTLNPVSAGTVTVTATQSDGVTYCGATVNQTVTISAAPIDVTLHYKGTSETKTGQTSPYDLTALSSPYTDAACTEWVFDGWYGSTYTNTSKPTYITELTSTGHAYAVYKHTEGGSGEGSTETFDFASIASDNSWENGIAYKSVEQGNVTIEAQGGGNNGKWYSSGGGSWRMYSGGTVSISSPSGDVTAVTSTPSCTFTIEDGVATFSPSARTDFTEIVVTIGGGGGTTYYKTEAECGPSLSASDAYVVSTKGQKVKVVVPVTAQNFSSNATLSYSGVSAPYSFVEWTNGNSITAGSTLETGLILQYQPSAYNTTNDLTVTFSATDASNKTATVHGRSLPEQFAIVATSSTKDWTMPANTANTAASRTGLEVTTSGTPETVEALPGSYVYTLVSVDNSRYDANGFAVRLKGYNTNGYLKAQAANQADVANLTDAATTDQYEWIITTTDHNTYNIASNNSDIAAIRNLRYYSKYFGMYAAGQASIRLLPIGCSTQPEQVVMTPTHNSVTITFVGTAATHTLVIKQGSTTTYNGTVTSGQEITGLSESTDYTYTLTPAGSAACAVEGEFSTTAAPIDITLVRHNRDDEVLTDVANPYTLPTAADACAEWVFVGWATSAQNNASSAPTLVTEATADGTYYAVYRKNGGAGSSSTVTDAFTYLDFEATSTSYEDFSDVSKTSSAVYAGNNAAGNSAIQLRTKNSNSGVVSTTSGGVVESVSVTWNSNTTSGRSLNIYGKNSAYTDASELYDSDTYGTLLGTIAYGSSTSLSISSIGTYTYIGIRSSSDALYLDALNIAWTTGATYTYSTAGYTDCVVCTESGAAFSMGNNVTKNTESANFTNTVTYTNTNSSTKTWNSSNTAVATVTSSGEVTIVGVGETVISLTQPVDYGATSSDDDNVCAVSISYTLTVTPPTVEVVEVTSDDKIIIEHDLEGVSNVIINEAQTKLSGELAEDIFFSKYYEAASNMKLFGLYNGTNTYIDLTKLRVRQSKNADDGWYNSTGSLGYVELANVSKLGEDFPSFMLPPLTEIIFWSNNYGTYGENSWTNNEDLRECVSMTINDVTYDIDDLEKGDVPNWYCLGDYKNYNTVDADGNNQFNFNGDDALILERNNSGTWEAIDIFGAGTSAAPKLPTYDTNNAKPSITSASDTENGKIKVVTNTSGSSNDTETYTINGTANTKLNDSPGGWWALSTDAEVTIPLSANRYYLLRNKNVKSGANAVASNTTRFATLGSEWHGEPVGGGSAAICYSGELFSEVGQYDFANYYTEWVEVSSSEIEFTEVGDGTMAVTVDNLASHSCNTLRIQVADAEDNVLAQVDYKVPIMVKSGTVQTTNTIFTGFDDAANVCSTCDVVIMNGATLKKVTGDVNAVRDIEVYAGGNLWIPNGQTFTVNQLIMRSKEDAVSTADIQGTLSRYNTTILHDKRIPGTRWYFFTLPYDCNIADITFRNGDPAVHGTDYLIKYYDGAERASSATAVYNGSAHWKQFTGATLLAGQGYIVAVEPHSEHTYAELRFPMADPDLTKTSTAVTVHAWGGDKTDEELRPNHKGWNLVGNPFLNTYQSNFSNAPLRQGTLELDAEGKYVINTEGAKNIRFVYVPVDGGSNNYRTVAIDGQPLDPFFAYFVQIGTAASKDGGDDPNTDRGVEFTSANVQKANIVRRAPAEINDDEPILVAVDLINDKQELDETTLLISNQFTDDFDMMDDGIKWRGDRYTNYTNPIIATRNNEGEMAFNALPDESAAVTGVPVNFYAAYNGQYTISLNGKYGIDEVKDVQLFDATTNSYYNLLTDNYTFTANKGNNTERFRLFVTVERNKVPTAVENPTLANVAITTFDKTLVLSGLNDAADIFVYDMSGKLIRSDQANGGGAIWRTVVPATGVYFVRVNTANGQQTLRAIVK